MYKYIDVQLEGPGLVLPQHLKYKHGSDGIIITILYGDSSYLSRTFECHNYRHLNIFSTIQSNKFMELVELTFLILYLGV